MSTIVPTRSVALFAPHGLLRSGLRALLVEHRLEVVELGPDTGESVVTWWDTYGVPVGLAGTLESARHAVCIIETVLDLAMIDRLCATHPGLPILALVPPDSTELSVLALAHGASSVAVTTCEAEELLANLAAAANGVTSVPAIVAQSLLNGTLRAPTELELTWLRQLGQGATVATVARLAGFSERSFYRRLSGVYLTLGTANRTEALLEARRRGLI